MFINQHLLKNAIFGELRWYVVIGRNYNNRELERRSDMYNRFAAARRRYLRTHMDGISPQNYWHKTKKKASYQISFI